MLSEVFIPRHGAADVLKVNVFLCDADVAHMVSPLLRHFDKQSVAQPVPECNWRIAAGEKIRQLTVLCRAAA